MSVISNLGSSLAAALPAINPHLHGHKRGSHVQSADETGASTAQVPTGLQQNLFGGLLDSLEQVIGVQATTPVSTATGTDDAAATGTSSTAATGTTDSPAAGTGTLGTAANTASTAAQSSLTSLQNYLNNLLNKSRSDGSPAARLAGSNLNVTA
jgi:hypothetical protein